MSSWLMMQFENYCIYPKNQIEKSITTPLTGFRVVYGISNNVLAPVDNSSASHLGYRPENNAEQYAAEIYASNTLLDPQDPGDYGHIVPFASVALGNSGFATLKIVDDTKKN